MPNVLMQNTQRSVESSGGLSNQLKIDFLYSPDFTALSSSFWKAHYSRRYNVNGDVAKSESRPTWFTFTF